MGAIAYELLERAIIACNGKDSRVARAVGRDWTGWGSIALYAAAVPLAYLERWISISIYVGIVALWMIPDSRMARVLER